MLVLFSFPRWLTLLVFFFFQTSSFLIFISVSYDDLDKEPKDSLKLVLCSGVCYEQRQDWLIFASGAWGQSSEVNKQTHSFRKLEICCSRALWKLQETQCLNSANQRALKHYQSCYWWCWSCLRHLSQFAVACRWRWARVAPPSHASSIMWRAGTAAASCTAAARQTETTLSLRRSVRPPVPGSQVNFLFMFV